MFTCQIFIIIILFSLHSRVNSAEYSGTSLTDVVEANDLIKAEKLLKEGADVNKKSPSGYTPLMIASGLGNSQMVELLLTAGADVTILDNRMGASALHKAAQSGNPQVAELLIRHGAFIDLQCPIQGNTPLIDAVWHKKPAVVRCLIKEGANIYIKTHGGATAMDFAKRDNLTEIINILRTEEERISKEIESQKLMKAVEANNLEEVKKLLKEGESPNEIYPLICSANDGYTPILTASRNGYTEIVRALLEGGADTHITCGLMKATPGHKAGYMGHPEVAKLLLPYGLELDAQGPYNGYTALHDAIWHGHTETAEVYIEGGARLDLKGHDGKTPLGLAEEYGYSDIADMIKKKNDDKNSIAENDIKSFVYEWFSWFDHQADEENFLSHISSDDLIMEFPEKTLKNHDDFKTWYDGIRKTIKSNSHDIKELAVTKNKDGIFEVKFMVLWKAKTFKGESIEQTYEQNWKIRVSPGNKLIIERYSVKKPI